ncbi:MAG: hypothetical protein IJQ37_07555 [Clostridia bacterium]|nr:hypothetical protein [Clostridia bacterium]
MDENEIKSEKKPKKSPQRRQEQKPTPPKLKVLFLIIPRQRAELYAALLQSYGINASLILSADGTASSEMLERIGLSDSDKAVVVGVVREDNSASALKFLEEKFSTVKNGRGIAFTVPMSSVIGVAAYRFLSDQK